MLDETWAVHAAWVEGLGPVLMLGVSLRWGLWFFLRSTGR